MTNPANPSGGDGPEDGLTSMQRQEEQEYFANRALERPEGGAEKAPGTEPAGTSQPACDNAAPAPPALLTQDQIAELVRRGRAAHLKLSEWDASGICKEMAEAIEQLGRRVARFDQILARPGTHAYAHKSHAEVAGMVRMLMRGDLNHEGVCVAARDRIIVLADALGTAEEKLAAKDAALVLADAVLSGLCCIGCSAQGLEMAGKCCRDADCHAGWSGINADEVAEAIKAVSAAHEGTHP